MNRTKCKIVTTVALFLVTVLTFAYSTYAYFTDSVSTSGGGISTGDMHVELIETSASEAVLPNGSIRIMPGMTVQRSIAVRNTGSLPVYIRIGVDEVITLAAAMQSRADEIDPSLITLSLNKSVWMLHDGYYYYLTPLESGGETAPLFTAVTFDKTMGNLYKDSTITFDFTVHALQSGNNGISPLNAVGWPEEGGNA